MVLASTTMSNSVAVIGLGTMGGPMAHNLLRAGWEVIVHNRTREKEERMARQSRDEDRSIDETLDLCWDLMQNISTKYLVRLDQKWIDKYHPTDK